MGLPLGERESETLELKGRDALKDRKSLGRAVVAFLNTRGGDLYIGIREENEIGIDVEAIENADEEALGLRDSLLNKVEPKPAPGEVAVSVERDSSGREILRVRVQRGAYGPYALLGANGARRYSVRIGSRTDVMSREDLAARFAGARAEEDRVLSVRKALRSERDEAQKKGEDQVWCAIQPIREVNLNTRDPELEALLCDPEAIGIEAGTPSFHAGFEPELRQGRLVVGVRIPGQDPDVNSRLKETTLQDDGGVRFHAVLELLYQHSTGSKPRVINPEVLIGVPLSLLRLAGAALAGHLDAADELIVDLALFGVGREQAVLFPGPWRLPWPRREAHLYEDGDDLTLTKPPVFTFGEVRESPERCVFRLLGLIYEAFGFREDAIPLPLDPRTGRPEVSA